MSDTIVVAVGIIIIAIIIIVTIFSHHHCCWCYTVFPILLYSQNCHPEVQEPPICPPRISLGGYSPHWNPCLHPVWARMVWHGLPSHCPCSWPGGAHGGQGLASLQPFQIPLESWDRLFGFNTLFCPIFKMNPLEVDQIEEKKSRVLSPKDKI